MIRTFAAAAAAVAIIAAPALAGPALPTQVAGGQMPAPDHQGQYFVTADGCSYSRALAPGYAPTWHLILNGAKWGLTDAHRRCAVMLGSYGQL